jgi:hypothetical protein
VANSLYPKYLDDLLNGAYDTVTASIGCALLNNSASYSSSDTDFTALVANRIGSTVDLTGVTLTGVTISANSVTFTGISASLTVKAVVLFHDTGGGASGALIAWFDTGTGLPLTTDGSDVTVNWNNTPTAGNIFAL